MREKTHSEFPVNSIRICIDSYEDSECQGRIYGVALENEISFSSSSDMIIKIDEAFNRIGQPQSSQVLRSFQKGDAYQSYVGRPKQFHESRAIAACQGKTRTCDLVMISRHRAEWQGVLKETDGELIGQFHSVLECGGLIEKAGKQ